MAGLYWHVWWKQKWLESMLIQIVKSREIWNDEKWSQTISNETNIRTTGSSKPWWSWIHLLASFISYIQLFLLRIMWFIQHAHKNQTASCHEFWCYTESFVFRDWMNNRNRMWLKSQRNSRLQKHYIPFQWIYQQLMFKPGMVLD